MISFSQRFILLDWFHVIDLSVVGAFIFPNDVNKLEQTGWFFSLMGILISFLSALDDTSALKILVQFSLCFVYDCFRLEDSL